GRGQPVVGGGAHLPERRGGPHHRAARPADGLGQLPPGDAGRQRRPGFAARLGAAPPLNCHAASGPHAGAAAMRRPALVTLGVLLVALAGCSKLNYEKTFTLDSPHDHWEAEFPSASGARKVQVTASAPSAINVCVVLIEDKADAEEALRRGTKPGKT